MHASIMPKYVCVCVCVCVCVVFIGDHKYYNTKGTLSVVNIMYSSYCHLYRKKIFILRDLWIIHMVKGITSGSNKHV